MPEGPNQAYPYGVVQHALQTAVALTARGARVGFLLYERCEDASAPTVRRRMVLGKYRAATLGFHFRMGTALTGALRSAVNMVTEGWETSPLLYLQTSVLLPFVPEEHAVLLTHHGPFVADVRRAIGTDGTHRAFDWDHAKADALEILQAEATEALCARHEVHCGEISVLQQAFLRRAGVPSSRLHRLPPPVGGARADTKVAPELHAAVAEPTDGLTAVTAVARLDHFKNVEMFVRGCVEALRSGDLTRAVVVGGPPSDPERDRLQKLVPRNLRPAFSFLPRQPREAVTGWLFPTLAPRGVFACTSRFDLVPYTALEAARTGLATLVPDTGAVGAAEYLPKSSQFGADEVALAGAFSRLAAGPPPFETFWPTAQRIAAATTDEAFAAAFEAACPPL